MYGWLKRRLAAHSLFVLCLILFLTFLDNTVVSVVLANVQSNLAAGVQDLQWIVDAYMLAFAVFMLSGGTLGDLLGRKKVMLSGVALFVAGSVVSMFAGSVDILIAGRAIMGLGAAASEPGTLSMIRQLYPSDRQRSRALGIWAAVSGIALAFGPIIGGIIIGFTSWRGVFAFGAIFGLIALAFGWLFLPESSDRDGRKLDLMGLTSGGISISALSVAVIMGENDGYSDPLIISLFVLSLIAMIAFILVEHKRKDPVLPLSFFKKLHFSLANIVAFSANFGIFAVFFFVALYLQFIAGFSGYMIALSFLAMTAAIVVAALIAGRLYALKRTLPMVIFGSLLSGGGTLILRHIINPNIGAGDLSWSLALTGIGFGILLVTMTSTVLKVVTAKRSGMAASTVNTFRELGGVFGVAVLGSIVNAQLTGGMISKLKAFNLPTNFESFIIYAITHGGHTPRGLHITIAELAKHAALINRVTQAAYDAFGRGLNIALLLAGSLLLALGAVTALIYILRPKLRLVEAED